MKIFHRRADTGEFEEPDFVARRRVGRGAVERGDCFLLLFLGDQALGEAGQGAQMPGVERQDLAETLFGVGEALAGLQPLTLRAFLFDLVVFRDALFLQCRHAGCRPRIPSVRCRVPICGQTWLPPG